MRDLVEAMFRFNNRKDDSGQNWLTQNVFAVALSRIAGRRTIFAEVTGKVGEAPS